MSKQTCELCGYFGEASEARPVRSNVRRFREQKFTVWRCAHCRSLHCEKVDNLASYYENYVLRRQELDYFVTQWYQVILRRLTRGGLQKSHQVLDYGCGSGLFLQFLRKQGYGSCVGYDPYVGQFKDPAVLSADYDFVVSFDVLEHVESPRTLIHQYRELLRPGGFLCLETPRADGIDLCEPEEYIHELHMPYHLHILSESVLRDLSAEEGFSVTALYDRWYMDSWLPCTSRRFLERFLEAHGNDVDAAWDPPRLGIILATPSLWFYALFGYLFPSSKKDHMMVILRKDALP